MKLTNNALQELYDTLMNLPLSMSPYVDSPVDKAFRECDEKLSESITFEEIKRLQSDNDILKRDNEALLSVNMEAISKNRKLEKDLDDAKKNVEYFRHSRDDWRSRAKHAEDEVKELKETLEKANADRTELQKDRDSYHGLYTELRKDYDKLFEENRKLKARTDCHRYEVEWYKKHYKEQFDKIKELKSRLNSMCGDEYIKKLQDSVRDIGYEQGQTDLWDALQNVNDINAEEFDVECDSMEDVISMDLEEFLDTYKNWQEQKKTERMRNWLAEFCVGRVCAECPLGSDKFKCGNGYSFRRHDLFDTRIIPDEDIKRYYEKARGCGAYNLKDGKLFIHDLSRPMESINRGFTEACEQFCKAVRDADIKLKENNPGISDRDCMKEACDAFAEGLKAGLASEVKEVPVSSDIPIKDLASWECTIEATVEINNDLLEKVCGVKPDEEAHKLEYGDAVRLIWSDYDYMYIGPDEKEGSLVRLFNPKKHDIVTTHIANVRYNGGKIVLTSEEDLRMVWKAKK